MSSCSSSSGESRRPVEVRVNAELVLDAGCCLDVHDAQGPLHVLEPPRTTLFRQVLAYLEEKPDPPRLPSGSMIRREGVAAAAVALRWGSYLAVLLDRQKPAWAEVDSPSTSRTSDEEMARVNIEEKGVEAARHRKELVEAASFLTERLYPVDECRELFGELERLTGEA